MFLPALTRRGRDHQERSSLRLVLNVHSPCLVNILFTLLQHIPLVNAEVAKGVAVIDYRAWRLRSPRCRSSECLRFHAQAHLPSSSSCLSVSEIRGRSEFAHPSITYIISFCLLLRSERVSLH